MAGLDQLFKQIGNIDSTAKLIAFLASAILLIVLAIIKSSNKISKRAGNMLIFLFALIGVLAGIAMLVPKPAPVRHTYTLIVTLTKATGIPYQYGEADVHVNNKTASGDYAPSAEAWTFVFDPVELPKNRSVYISSQTKDQAFYADTSILLSEDPIQTIRLPLRKDPAYIPPLPPPDPTRPRHPLSTTFSINLPDESIQRDIAKNTGLRYDAASMKNRIVITYDPEKIIYMPMTTNFTFKESSPIVLIDGTKHTLDGCTIPERIADSHDKETMKSYAADQSIATATSFIRQNPTLIPRWLKSLRH